MTRDDDRLAQASRALRHRAGLSQVALVGGNRSRHTVRLLENGRAGELRLDEIRSHFARLGGRVHLSAWFEGALIDRLIDAEHAEVVNASIATVGSYGWARVDPEVTFNEWGERGSIDFFGAHEPARAVVVGEAKSAWGSIEETLRSLDVKARLAPTIAEKRFGWRPEVVALFWPFPRAAVPAESHNAMPRPCFRHFLLGIAISGIGSGGRLGRFAACGFSHLITTAVGRTAEQARICSVRP